MGTSIQQCPFCNDQKGQLSQHPASNDTHTLKCPRVCGDHVLSLDTKEKLSKTQQISPQKIKCVKENITNSEKNTTVFWVTKDEIEGKHSSNIKTIALENKYNLRVFEEFQNIPIDHSKKCDELLLLISHKTLLADPFDEVRLDIKDLFNTEISSIDEGSIWLNELVNRELAKRLTGKEFAVNIIGKDISYKPQNERVLYGSITPKGWQHIAKLNKGLDSNKVFIAMQFKDEQSQDRSDISDAIKNACKAPQYNLNFVAERIDKKEHNNKICDEILAEIRRAKFIIADYTFNNFGVYFEAGFAQGLGREVIRIIKKTADEDNNDITFNKIHFDENHQNFIVYEDAQDLERKLADRIASLFMT